MGACTLPGFLGFKNWFNAHFSDLCDIHDLQYDIGYPRKRADIELAIGIADRNYPAMAVLTYIVVRLVGWAHYSKEKPRHV